MMWSWEQSEEAKSVTLFILWRNIFENTPLDQFSYLATILPHSLAGLTAWRSVSKGFNIVGGNCILRSSHLNYTVLDDGGKHFSCRTLL